MVAGIEYKLTETEIKIIQNMSKTICDQGRDYFVDNFKYDKITTLYDMNVNGFGAELAFCRLAEIEFDSSTISFENHFLKHDCILPDGRTVDVKNTKYSTGSLIVGKGKEKMKVDVYVLMIGIFPKYKFVGWCSYLNMINTFGTDDKFSNCYCIKQINLNKILFTL